MFAKLLALFNRPKPAKPAKIAPQDTPEAKEAVSYLHAVQTASGHAFIAYELWELMKNTRQNETVYLADLPVAAKPLHQLMILYKKAGRVELTRQDGKLTLAINEDGLRTKVNLYQVEPANCRGIIRLSVA